MSIKRNDVLTHDGMFLEPYLPKETHLIPAWLNENVWGVGEKEDT